MKRAFVTLLPIVSILIAGSAFYYQVIYQEKTIINIEKVSEVLLTKPLIVDGLSARYTYNDTIDVENLWQTTFLIRNTGDKSIYGVGFSDQTIRQQHIPFAIIDCDKLLSAKITNENNGAFIVQQPNIIIAQWKPKEYIEITTITEGKTPPQLKISDREIKDSEITYSIYSPDNKEYKPKLADRLSPIVKIVILFNYLIVAISIIWEVIRNRYLSTKRHNSIIKKSSSLSRTDWFLLIYSGFSLVFAFSLPLLWIF